VLRIGLVQNQICPAQSTNLAMSMHEFECKAVSKHSKGGACAKHAFVQSTICNPNLAMAMHQLRCATTLAITETLKREKCKGNSHALVQNQIRELNLATAMHQFKRKRIGLRQIKYSKQASQWPCINSNAKRALHLQ
jgi:hypothetical protein